MRPNDKIYRQYVQILKEELVPAMGCTEPIALAYAAATARDTLGEMPERVKVFVSGNIIKNVKSVVVPHTGGLRGIESAIAVGIVAGRADKKLEVLSAVTEEEIEVLPSFIRNTPIEVCHADTPHIFYIDVQLFGVKDNVSVRIVDFHTNIVSIQKNGVSLYEAEEIPRHETQTDRSCLSIEEIIRFADDVTLEDVAETLERQIACNYAIAEEGLRENYGANIGKVLMEYNGGDLFCKMRAYAAAGSDARMNGCELPVIINSGSGNQGLTASLPVIVFAKEKGLPHEALLRALCVANLVTIHLKSGIGRLSAYCGVVSAGCGAASGVAYLMGGRYDMIAHTIVNTLAMDSGIVCDGAKASCAAKISSAVDAGMLGLTMYQHGGNQFLGGDGIVKKGVENTIRSVGRLARNGMRQTDEEIIRLMLED